MRELTEYAGLVVPRMNVATLFKGLFTPEKMAVFHAERNSDLAKTVLPNSYASASPAHEVIQELEDHDLPAIAEVIGTLSVLFSQTNRRSPLLTCTRTSLARTTTIHRDNDPIMLMRFVVVENGGGDYFLNGSPRAQHAGPGDTVCLNNLSAFADTRPLHGIEHASGYRSIVNFIST